MPQVDSLAFTKIKIEFLDSLHGKCAQEKSYEKVWNVVSLKDLYSSELSSALGSTLVMRPSIIVGRTFTFMMGTYSIRNDEYVYQRTMKQGAKY